MDELKAGNLLCDATKKLLASRYDLSCNALPCTIETLKQQVVAIAGRLSRYRKQALRCKQNQMFCSNQQLLYKQLLNKCSSPNHSIPDSQQVLEFWGSIWSYPKIHNSSAQWLETIKSELETSVALQDDIVISTDKVTQFSKRLSNWKAPGIDQLHGFWIKHLSNLHSRIAAQLQYVFINGPPDWMTVGRTVLVVKEAEKGSVPSNFRPITCLPTIWKLLSGILADGLYHHLQW